MGDFKRHYSPGERRALNIVWNGAGRYDFRPAFLAVRHDRPDLYMNLIIGFSAKYLDSERLNFFFLSFRHAPSAAVYDEAVWFTLEQYLYEKEKADRPALTALREHHAANFLENEGRMSRQEMMARNMSLFSVEKYRYLGILGEKQNHLSPGEKKLLRLTEIEKPGNAAAKEDIRSDGTGKEDGNHSDGKANEWKKSETDFVIGRLKDLLTEGFHFTDFRMDAEHVQTASGPLKDALDHLLHREVHHVDSLLKEEDISAASDSVAGNPADGGLSGWKERHETEVSDADRDYIRACFGPCVLPPKEWKLLEHDLCRGTHELCRLWVAKRRVGNPGGVSSAPRGLSESDLVSKETREQEKKNQAFLHEHAVLIESEIRQLSAELDTVLATFREPLPEFSRVGRLEGRKAWRMHVLSDPEVFVRPGDEAESSLSVDILLDGSASRMKHQEEIASQAWILARSLRSVRVRTRFLAFHSLRGFTVLDILKDYDETDLSGIFRYSAAGWNRDGLALRLTGRLIPEHDGQNHMLLIMTDANPSDSTKIPAGEHDVFLHGYGNEAGVQDTADAVKSLKQAGILTGAIYTGPDLYLGNARRIYGRQVIRVRHAADLADGVSELLTRMLREK